MSKAKWTRGILPHITPSPTPIDLSRTCALGSCFSRNIYRWLSHHNVLTEPTLWETLFNPFAILNEFRRLFQGATNWKENIIYQKNYDHTILIDPWRTWLISNSLDELMERNNTFDISARLRLHNSKTIILTYGLIEAWRRSNGCWYVNNLFPRSIKQNQVSKEYVCEMVKYQYVLDSISETISLIRKYLSDDVQIILTLSPIPLKFSFTHTSLREANNISKSTLLIAINEVCSSQRNVLYFPSYELVQGMSERNFNSVWQSDERHISALAIDQIAGEFVKFCNFKVDKSNRPFSVPLVNSEGIIVGDIFSNGAYTRRL